jgi:integrase
MFQVLIEMGLLDQNPVCLVMGPSDRDGKREVYVSSKDFKKIVSMLPARVRPIVQTLYYTGMARSQVLGLTWDNVNLIPIAKNNDLLTTRHPGESRGPEHTEKTGFRLPPE